MGKESVIDLVGKSFGYWIVLKRCGSDRYHYAKWMCRCACGTERIVSGRILRSGLSNSCGCQKPMPHGRLPNGEASFRQLYRETKYNAKYRGIKWELDLEFFRKITKECCHYCGIEPYQIHHPKNFNGEYIFNGIDRVDNEIGYFPNNCVSCCGVCNYMKSATDVNDFREWIIQVYNHWASKS